MVWPLTGASGVNYQISSRFHHWLALVVLIAMLVLDLTTCCRYWCQLPPRLSTSRLKQYFRPERERSIWCFEHISADTLQVLSDLKLEQSRIPLFRTDEQERLITRAADIFRPLRPLARYGRQKTRRELPISVAQVSRRRERPMGEPGSRSISAHQRNGNSNDPHSVIYVNPRPTSSHSLNHGG